MRKLRAILVVSVLFIQLQACNYPDSPDGSFASLAVTTEPTSATSNLNCESYASPQEIEDIYGSGANTVNQGPADGTYVCEEYWTTGAVTVVDNVTASGAQTAVDTECAYGGQSNLLGSGEGYATISSNLGLGDYHSCLIEFSPAIPEGCGGLMIFKVGIYSVQITVDAESYGSSQCLVSQATALANVVVNNL